MFHFKFNYKQSFSSCIMFVRKQKYFVNFVKQHTNLTQTEIYQKTFLGRGFLLKQWQIDPVSWTQERDYLHFLTRQHVRGHANTCRWVAGFSEQPHVDVGTHGLTCHGITQRKHFNKINCIHVPVASLTFVFSWVFLGERCLIVSQHVKHLCHFFPKINKKIITNSTHMSVM